jgi:hypothetical protein
MELTWLTYNGSQLAYSGSMVGTSDIGPYTLRCQFKDGYDPSQYTVGESITLVDAVDNVWDVYDSRGSWSSTFGGFLGNVPRAYLIRVIDADATGVTSMDSAFAFCYYLEDVKIRNMGSVTNTEGMFQQSAVRSVELDGLGSSLTDMGSMFRYCNRLEEAPLFDTSSVVNMRATFNEAIKLKTIPSYFTQNVQDMYQMCAGCDSLESIPLLRTDSVQNMEYAFLGCYKVKTGALALYQQASSQANPPSRYGDAFEYCGRDDPEGAAELAQIPTSWGGTMA